MLRYHSQLYKLSNARKFEVNKTIDNNKNTYWTVEDSVINASITIDFGKPTTFNHFLAQEYIILGQRVKAFTIEAFVEGEWKELARATTIGDKRILRFATVEATKLRFDISDSKSCPVISNIGIYNAPQLLDPPCIIRNPASELSFYDIETNDFNTEPGKWEIQVGSSCKDIRL